MPGSRSSSAFTMLLLPPPDGAATTNSTPDAPGARVVIVIDGLPHSLSASLHPRCRTLQHVSASLGRAASGPAGLGLRHAALTRPHCTHGAGRFNTCRPPSVAPRRALRASGFATRPSLEILHLLAHLLDQHLELERHLRKLRVDGFRAERIRLAMQLLSEKIQPLADRSALCQHAADFGYVRGEPRDLLGDVDLRREQRELLLESLFIRVCAGVTQPRAELLEIGVMQCRD